jgi:hypothetical protein
MCPSVHFLFFYLSKGAVIIYGGGWHRREKGWVNKILSKRLRKWKRKQLMGWVIKIYCHFQSMTHWNIGDWDATVINMSNMARCHQYVKYGNMSSVVCQYNMWINQSHYILIISPFVGRQRVSPKKVHVQTKWNFRLQNISQAIIKLMSQKW